MSKTIKAITLWQPWASLVAVGAKKIETRSWGTKYRGPLAIHAAKLWNQELESYLSSWEFQTGLAPLVGKPLDLLKYTWSGVEAEQLPRGVIVAICNLTDCIPTDNLTLEQIGTDFPFGNWARGRFAWMLADVRPLTTPISAKGKQGLWEWEVPETRGWSDADQDRMGD